MIKNKKILITHRRRFVILTCIAFVLLIPFIAMQFTSKVNWSLIDFIVAGTLLLSAGFILELILVLTKNNVLRPFLILLLITVFILTWLELAVGIFGTPFAGS